MYLKLLSLLFFALVILNPAVGQDLKKANFTEGINENFLKTLVSVEEITKSKKARPIGSGFLAGSPGNHVVLVTAKHVVTNKGGTLKKNLAYRLRDKLGSTVLVSDSLMRTIAGEWFLSKSQDVACRFVALPDSHDAKTIASKFFLRQKYVRSGAPVLVLGFPLGLRSEEYANPIVRRGVVARSDSENLMVDGAIFPGNSGGPVIYTPTLKFGPGFTASALNEERVIGLVSKLITYGRTFKDNAGLAIIVPTDAILALLNRADVVEFDKTLPSGKSSRINDSPN